MLAHIELNEELIQAAMQATGLGSEAEAVEAGLKLLLRQEGYARLLELGGKLRWEDNATESPEPRT
ncbi:MAG: type II toxin-antitoxin system VapB family antitoxin [Methylococcales bacterium]|nr:type II toxin-antitoxin system VapB family antitoxin [Methylococcales bacterium]